MSSVPTVSAEQVADFYDVYNKLLRNHWDDNFHFGYWIDENDKSSIGEATDRFNDVMISKLPVGPGARVLDLGCGIGKPTVALAKATGASVVGISINQNQVDLGTERAAEEGLADRVTFQVADAHDLPFEDNSFDAVLAFESIVHMKRLPALNEVARVLKPGGRVALTDLFKLDEKDSSAADSGFLTQAYPRLSDYPRLTAAAGLELDELIDVSAHTDRTYREVAPRLQIGAHEIATEYGPEVMKMVQEVMAATGPSMDAMGCLIMAGHLPA